MYLCHTFCELGATPLADALDDIRDFLVTHPDDVLVVINQDYVTPADFVSALDRAGLAGYALAPPQRRWNTRTLGIAALAAGTAYAKAHPATALAVMQRHASRDYRDALSLSVRETLPLLDVRTPDVAAWTRFGRWMQAQGLLHDRPDGATLVARP